MTIKKYHIFFFTLIYITIFSCSKEDEKYCDNIKIYGHGGAGFESFFNKNPPNSFKSIRKAVEGLNVEGIELDVQIDNQGKVWLFHDQYLQESTNCTGCLGEKDSEYVSNCEYSDGSKIFSLQELINYFKLLKHFPEVSIQAQIFERCSDYNILANSIISIIKSNDAYDWIQVESDAKELLMKLKNSSNRFQLFLDTKDAETGITVCSNYGFSGFIMFNEEITKGKISEAKSIGLKVGLYGVSDYWETKKAIEKCPDQIQTDNIELIQRMLH